MEETKDIKNAAQGRSEELLQLVSFTIGGEEFGVDISRCKRSTECLK